MHSPTSEAVDIYGGVTEVQEQVQLNYRWMLNDGRLLELGKPHQVVAVNYGDLPIKFYTRMRVIGGLTGEDMEEAREADWIVLRRSHVGGEEDARVRRFLKEQLASGGYERLVIDYPDTPFENREDPNLHRFKTARDVPPVRMFRRRGAGG